MTTYNDKEQNIELAEFIEFLDKEFWIATAAGDKKAAEDIMDFKQSVISLKQKLDSVFTVKESDFDEEVLEFLKRNDLL
jgi:hypothetical protein